MEAFVEAFVDVTFVEASTTSMKVSVEVFVEATSMEVFPEAFAEVSVFFSMEDSITSMKASIKVLP